jgi:Aldo/keto reductase family
MTPTHTTVELGMTGLEIFPIAFGASELGGEWGRFDEDEGIAAIRRARSLGVNLFDTAQGYGFAGTALDPRDRGDQPPTEMSTFPTAPLSTAECAAAVSSRPKRCSGRPNSSPTWNAPSSIARLMSAAAAAIRCQPTV